MALDFEDPIVTAPIATPFEAAGGGDRVDYDALERNVERLLATKLRGYLIGSATGEETPCAPSPARNPCCA